MTKKKQGQPAISQSESEQAQAVLTRYRQIARQLQTSNTQPQIEEALAEINNLPAGAQFTLLKELAKELEVAAADVLAAVHAFGALKDARKEARRSLIRLEGAKIYPTWEAPPVPAFEESALATVTVPPRFFKGLITDSREIGEMQLILCWEMGEDYREVRMLGFLLEFWSYGVRDFFTQVESKRSFANLLAQMTSRLSDVKLKECSLEEGVRLLEEAKAVNARLGTRPHSDYTRHLALINQLIPESLTMQVIRSIEEHNLEEEEGHVVDEIDMRKLSPREVVTGFVSELVNGDPFRAYPLLAQDSPLREGLARQAWFERRAEWGEKFAPRRLLPGFVAVRETARPKIWLPMPSKKSHEQVAEVEAGWSVELEELLLDDADRLSEWPKPFFTYPDAKRQWFWATFTLVREDNTWHIQNITDESAPTLELSVEAIREHMQEPERQLRKITGRLNLSKLLRMKDAEKALFAQDMVTPLARMLYYYDILIRKEPENRQNYTEAYGLALLLEQYEHQLVVLQTALEHFPEDHAMLYGQIANAHQHLAPSYLAEDEEDYYDEERNQFHLGQAEKALFASLALEENADTRMALADVLFKQGERLDEAKSQLLQVQKEVSDPEKEALIELRLSEIAIEQEQIEVAISHAQRATELQPNDADHWDALGEAQHKLNQISEAEASYKRAIELDPHDTQRYSTLSLLYKDTDQPAQAIQVLKNGLTANPEAVELYVALASLYAMEDDFQQAEKLMEKAERIDPDSSILARFRETFALMQVIQPHAAPQPLKLAGQKKKKRHH